MSRGERIIAVISRDRRAETVRVYRKTPRRRTARSTSTRASRNADDETRRSKESRDETTREERDDDDDGDDDDASSTSVRASFLRAIVANESLGTRLVSLSRVGTGTGTGTGTAGAEPRDAVDALASRLGSSCATGLEDASRVERNRAAYGANAARGRATKTTLDFAREALEDPTLIALAVSGAASLLLETRLVATRGGDADEPAWLNGAAILLAVLVVVVVECVNNEQKQRAFMNLNAASEETSLSSVTRAGARTLVPRRDVVVGDVVDLQAGDVSPADALVCESADFLVDQSHITGESDESKKRPGDVVFAGSRVTSGRGSALSVAVGETSSCGEIAEMIGVGGEDATPLQRRLQKLAFDIGSYGVAAAACVGTILAWKTTVDAVGGTISGAETTVGYLDDVIVAVTIIVVSVPEVRFSTPLAFFCFFFKIVRLFPKRRRSFSDDWSIGNLSERIQLVDETDSRLCRLPSDERRRVYLFFLVDVLRLDDDLSIGNLSETRASLKRKHSVCRLPSERRRRRFDIVRRDESLTAAAFYHFRRDYRSP
tara:strand:+ start:22369 stop:24009 length:1641 start_codon:yes stop_codon:yes gene_type:complete